MAAILLYPQWGEIYAIGGVAVNRVPFEALKPSISTSYEAGAQLIFFNSRINMDLSWYRS